MERKKRSKGRGWERCYVKKNYGTFGVEMRACGQKLVKFCTRTHAAKLVVEIKLSCIPAHLDCLSVIWLFWHDVEPAAKWASREELMVRDTGAKIQGRKKKSDWIDTAMKFDFTTYLCFIGILALYFHNSTYLSSDAIDVSKTICDITEAWLGESPHPFLTQKKTNIIRNPWLAILLLAGDVQSNPGHGVAIHAHFARGMYEN